MSQYPRISDKEIHKLLESRARKFGCVSFLGWLLLSYFIVAVLVSSVGAVPAIAITVLAGLSVLDKRRKS